MTASGSPQLLWNPTTEGTLSDRLQAGKALRSAVPRSAHALWEPPVNRPDPVEILQQADAGRLPNLVPIRYGRMLASPFAFFRGAAAIMGSDLSFTPPGSITIQICGDAHLLNFGAYATPERNLVFGLNDFDETTPGPWEWDVKRLAASFVVASRDNGFREQDCAETAQEMVQSYREQLNTFVRWNYLDVWYARLDASAILKAIPDESRKPAKRRFEQASHNDNVQALARLASVDNGQLRIDDDPPLITHIHDPEGVERLTRFLHGYLGSLQPDRQDLLSRYTYVDFAEKVVGIGSVGTRCYLVLLYGRDQDDPLFLQVKEARLPALEPYVGRTSYENQGERVVRGQQLLQAASDIFLGWGREGGTDYYIRQLRDMKGSVNPGSMTSSQMQAYARICGWALAFAHARSRDAVLISGYIGEGDTFDRAVAAFAANYADQNEQDYQALVNAVREGRIEADGEV
jgi:uncharacterized protein (DUF2252 family)